jgi:hypothetical protein
MNVISLFSQIVLISKSNYFINTFYTRNLQLYFNFNKRNVTYFSINCDFFVGFLNIQYHRLNIALNIFLTCDNLN